jgi:amidohydrolase
MNRSPRAEPPPLRDAVAEIAPGVIADRRYLHQHPELAFHEEQTARFVAERLRALGAEDIRTGIATTGVTALIRGSGDLGSGPTVLLRADIDALPIQEDNTVTYRSVHPGVMHACGHDGHTAILLATARLLLERRHQFAGTVKLCFQPAEEVPPGGGALPMIEAGVLDDPAVDAAFGLHLLQALPVGVIGVRPGPVMATGTVFHIVIRGRGRPRLTSPPDRRSHRRWGAAGGGAANAGGARDGSSGASSGHRQHLPRGRRNRRDPRTRRDPRAGQGLQ